MSRIDKLRMMELERNIIKAKLDLLITLNNSVQRINEALQQLRS